MDSCSQYKRFSVLNRCLHLFSMIGFLGLAITGLSLGLVKYGLFCFIAKILGGSECVSTMHKTFAVFTYLCVLIHFAWLIYYKAVLGKPILGPNSAMITSYDLKTFLQHIRHNLGLGEYPLFYRFTYWEKFDYLAMVVGMHTMGITGILIWYPEFWSHHLPGIFIDMARMLHFYEAIMAVFLKIIIHITTTHLRPEVFPLDKSIFTGFVSLERMQADHPKELGR